MNTPTSPSTTTLRLPFPAAQYPADLSNERHDDVLRRRAVLVDWIRTIITRRLAGHPALSVEGTR